jgi:hypothetical protein
MRRIAHCGCAALALLFGSQALAQIGGNGADGAFHPPSDVTLDTTARPGGWDFTTITIPAGVTVRLVGPQAAILRSQGAVRIDGHLNADGFASVGATGGVPGAGGYAGGNGGIGSSSPGAGPAGGQGSIAPFGNPGNGYPGGHATPGMFLGVVTGTYGSDWVFDLRGGSGAGGSANPASIGQPGPGGGGGGGVAVVLTDSTLDLRGMVTARGGGMGAAGGIFLRALGAFTVAAGATIDAAGNKPFPGLVEAGDGYVRLDGYGTKPVLDPGATIVPAPRWLFLPAMRHARPPQRGATYTVEAATVPGDTVAFFVSPRSASIPLPPLGTLELDPGLMLLLGTAVAPANELDPQATLGVPVPNDPSLAGLFLWQQSINAITAVPAGPRLSNAFVMQVQ